MANPEGQGIGREHKGFLFFTGNDLANGSTPPDYPVGDEGFPQYDVADDSIVSFIVPLDWMINTSFVFTVNWYVDENYAVANGEVQWELDYELVPHDESEAIGSAPDSGNGVTGDIDIPDTALTVASSEILTIPSSEIESIDEVRLILSRIPIDDGAAPTADPSVQSLVLEYTKRFPVYRK